MYGHLEAVPAQTSIVDVLNVWMDESVLAAIKQIVNSNLEQSAFVSTEEIRAFIEAGLWLGFYSTVSITTSLCLGSHVASRGESNVDIVKILQRSLCSATTESQIRLPGIVHALDRGYQSEAVHQQIHSVDGKIVGIHKRTCRFPFAYGKRARPYQRDRSKRRVISILGRNEATWC
ncbi:hypothetical protein PHMEG_00032023 [Phytophthora megakarya]|uniref:Transposase n=1 Tax=Phytophthora megakarya TaxID=4795 RepID=A0A225UX86_9STRA|nr:hypothetical protein PHMEG_00032023 [Phytophthora megakarya]